MERVFRPTFVIAWAQTELDGLRRASREMMAVGSSWRWSGTALRIDVPRGPLVLSADGGAAHERLWAAASVRQLVNAAISQGALPLAIAPGADPDAPVPQPDGFVVTDGLKTYEMSIIDEPSTGARLIMAEVAMPPVDQDLWVTRIGLCPAVPIPRVTPHASSVICFCQGTRLATPDGGRAIESLRPGDLIATKDNGPQEILWIGHRHLSGARLHAMPHLRPVRFRSGAFGIGQPDDDLVVSPQHRMLVRSAAARDLFGSDDVLVAAEQLLNGGSVTRDQTLREVTYIHVMLARHNVIWANGLETESFHPGQMDLTSLDPDQFRALVDTLPGLALGGQAYGAEARRNATALEAARLRQAIAA